MRLCCQQGMPRWIGASATIAAWGLLCLATKAWGMPHPSPTPVPLLNGSREGDMIIGSM